MSGRRRITHYDPDEVEQRPADDMGPLFDLPTDELADSRGSQALAHVAGGNPAVRLEPPSVPIDTSEEAALGIMDRSGQLRARILAHLEACRRRGATEREVERALDMEGQGSTVRPRLWELEGNVPAGRNPRPRLIVKTLAKREGMRVYVALSCAPELA